MVRRRAVFNPLEPSPAPRWYVVRSMHGAVIESRPVVAGANLTHVFITAMLAWMEELERRMVSIDPTDPYEPHMYGASHLSGGSQEYD
jgi:hypothetical protein